MKNSVKEVLSTSNRTTLKPLVTIFAVFTLEQILTTKSLYHCPTVGYRFYGGLFLFGPGVCFFALTLLLNKSFWASVTGCYRGGFDLAQLCQRTCKAVMNGVFVGFVWLVLTFANTEFYVCFCLGGMPSQALLNEIRTQSTVIAWTLFLSVVLLSLLLVVVQKCCCSDVEGSLPSVYEYEKLEAEAAVAKFQEQMEVLARKEGERQVEIRLNSAENNKDAYDVVRKTKMWLAAKYPRATGDSTKRYRVDNEQADQALHEKSERKMGVRTENV